MASTDANIDRNKRVNLSKNLVEEGNTTAKETNWITDDIPVTIFRASYGSSGTILHYLSNNVEELTGYSKIDFLDNKITLDDLILPEDIQDYYNSTSLTGSENHLASFRFQNTFLLNV